MENKQNMIENIMSEISYAKTSLQQMVIARNNYMELSRKPLLLPTWVHVISYIAFMYAITGMLMVLLNLFTGESSGSSSSGFGYVLLLLSYLFVVWVLYYSLFKKFQSKLHNKKLHKNKARLSHYEDQFNVSRELLNNTATSIPAHYWTLNALTKLQEYFTNGRADTLKEALNLYESEKHHNAHLQALAEVRMLQEETLKVTNENNRLQWIDIFRR